MIDWKTILSSFDDKPTLLQWLKIVEMALQNASLEDVAIKNTGNTMYVFEFKFADGSTVTSSPINFLKEISGIEKVSDEIVGTQTLTTLRVDYIDGTSDDFSVAAENGKDGKAGKDGNAGKGISSFEDINNAIVGTKTVTTLRVHYTDGTTEDISVAAENGKDGKAGKGVSRFEAISNEIVGNQTVTTVRAHYTDGTTGDFSVYAQNGSGATNIFMHKITGVLDDTEQHGFKINFLSTDNRVVYTLSEFVDFCKNNKCYIPTVGGNLMYHTVSLSGDNKKVKLTAFVISDGKLIEGNAAAIVSDEVVTI